jgi:hypothetical protein
MLKCQSIARAFPWFLSGVLFIGLGHANASLGVPHPGPIYLSMDDKVNCAQYVVIARPVRIYFVDNDYKEREPIVAAGFQRAAFDLEIEAVLYPPNTTQLKTAVLDDASSNNKYELRESMFEAQQRRYIGSREIYFLNSQQISHKGNDGVTLNLLRFFRPSFPAIRGPVENPLPLSYLTWVHESVLKRIDTDQRRPDPGAMKYYCQTFYPRRE